MTENFFMKRTFDSFSEMAEVLRGWNIEIRQLQEGKIQDTLSQLKIKNYFLACGEFSGPTHQIGDIPHGRTFAFYTGKDSKLIWRKKDVPHNALMIFPLNSKLDVVIKGSKTTIHTISILEEELISRLTTSERDIYNTILSSKELVSMKLHEMEKLREVFYRYLQSAEDSPDLINEKNLHTCLSEELMSALIDVLLSGEECDYPEVKDRILQTWNELESYIERHKHRPIMLSELSQAVGIGERSLFRLFNDRFDLSPKAYLNKLRLNGVRKDLDQVSSTKRTITQVANDWGYWHMGQFAADYKQLFGELPSETLSKANL